MIWSSGKDLHSGFRLGLHPGKMCKMELPRTLCEMRIWGIITTWGPDRAKAASKIDSGTTNIRTEPGKGGFVETKRKG